MGRSPTETGLFSVLPSGARKGSGEICSPGVDFCAEWVAGFTDNRNRGGFAATRWASVASAPEAAKGTLADGLGVHAHRFERFDVLLVGDVHDLAGGVSRAFDV